MLSEELAKSEKLKSLAQDKYGIKLSDIDGLISEPKAKKMGFAEARELEKQLIKKIKREQAELRKKNDE